MCGRPKVVQQNPEADAAKAAAKAAAENNIRKAMRRGGLSKTSMLSIRSPEEEQETADSTFAEQMKKLGKKAANNATKLGGG